ncbi:MAG: hypothetical protein K9J37_17050 [Saprospiraceae bacterium]|nr:hypothetical protein [Saprospiraceae bacterium]MCF8251625.1 hypothetical protein [Saprospiraceae bacterium]MCF8281346.1 hypothetical protein [Bacteroidales bacterium]MCF8312285.1 hypothetical protein [Saprospiraceae bacterium]MCF8441993.1 hypothetical protein [Saprospiraceae bacterium]
MEEQQLTENIIKKVALRFFRHYYKFRLRYEDQPVVAKYDLEGVGGIVADGFYSFKKPDGKPFTATFEATSKISKDEVIFRSDNRILLWDGLAVTGFVMVLLAFFNYQNHFHALDNTKLGERIALLVMAGALVLGIFYLIARNFRRYRYIYAVEQFKKYHADEQWVALGSDVFEDKNDKNLRELKSQCVFNGIGLLTVDKNLDPKIIITPSRHDIFAGKRQSVDFLSQKQVKDLDKKGKIELFPSLFGFSKKDNSVLRHQKNTHTQVAMVIGSMALLAIIFTKELENPAFQLVEKQEFTDNIAKSKSNTLSEPEAYLPDSSSMPKRKKGRTNESFWTLQNAKETTPVPAESAIAESSLRSAGGDELTAKGGGEIVYDCSRFYNFDGKKFIVEVGELSDYKVATVTVKAIRGKGIYAAALLKSCFTEEKKGFLVYAGEIYNTAAEASKEMDGWVAKNKLTKTEVRNWKIRAIEPVLK